MNVTYDKDPPESLEDFFCEFVLSKFGVKGDVSWQRHVQTDPDSFLHVFLQNGVRYALAFDDYPGGFSVDGEPFVKAVQLENGDKELYVEATSKYVENVTGGFMLFQIMNEEAFDTHLMYLELEYAKLRKEWQSSARSLVAVARDVLQLAETAAANHDTGSLYAVRNIIDAFCYLNAKDNSIDIETLKEYVDILHDAEFGYEMHDEADKKRVGDEVYKYLSHEAQLNVLSNKYVAQNLGQTVTLVTAMYAKHEGDAVNGTSIAILMDGKEVEYPNEHFLREEIERYFAEHSYLRDVNIAHHMPPQLGDYTLVQGSEEVNVLFRRELPYVAF